MKLIDEIKLILEGAGYEFLESGSNKALEHPKEIRIRFDGDESVELEPHIFEANDIKKHLEEFKIIEHDPNVIYIKTGETHKSHYSMIIERN
ncbi:hypothetical protein [Psychrilyobacter sp.]|uniref:hypothetical protein n=1 Tax=Psychrilyobacter sp. TaxID=2586924 RepID=UPI003018928E